MTLHTKLLWVFLALGLPAFLAAQTEIPAPSAFLPHTHGQQFTYHHQLVDYYQEVAAVSDRVKLVEYGLTPEGRPLLLAFLSAPQNLARLKDIRNANLARTGLIEGDPEAFSDIAIVWLSFGVHGNEAGSSESALSTLYELTRPDRPEVAEWLQKVVVILDPSVNPDGYARYTSWYRQVAGIVPDAHPSTIEHREPWPGGRPNHYLFDLNRDWAWATQQETRKRLAYYSQWMPHIHADFHEQFPDEPYYFAPAAEPFHAYISDWQRSFQRSIGENHTRYFDAAGWLYFTREYFDLLYPSYGDTYPTFNGAIGMTYEQAGHGVSGRAIQLETGDELTLADRIEHHTATALSTVEMAARHAPDLVREFESFFRKAQLDPPGPHRSFVLPAGKKSGDLQALCAFLDLHHIRYGRIDKPRTIRAYHYQSGKDQTITVQPSDLVISAYQPQGILAQILLEPEPALADSMTYDITAWALPYAYGLDAYASEERLDPIHSFPTKQAPVSLPEGDAYAYLSPWEDLEDARFLGSLLQAGIHVRFLTEATTLDGKNYEPGTLVITRGDNRKISGFSDLVVELASKHGAPLAAVPTGMVEKGKDLGSASLRYIKKPRVLLLRGDQVNSHSFGQLWFYFEQQIEYPVGIADLSALASLDLRDYNLLILPDGYYELDANAFSKVDAWVRDGGRLIAIGNALRSFEGKEGIHLRQKMGSGPEVVSALRAYGTRSRESLSGYVPGSVFQTKVDITHPLAYGIQDPYFTLKTEGPNYEFLSNGWNVGYLAEDFLWQGFVGNQALEPLKNSLVFGVEPHGRGQMVYLVDNPLFRSFWRKGLFLFSNAVFLVGQE